MERVRNNFVAVSAAICGAALLILTSVPTAASAATLSSLFSSAIKSASLDSTQQASCVLDASGKQALTDNADMRIIPASVSKLYTADLALSTMPIDFHYSTDFYVNGTTLYINGGGDAEFVEEHLHTIIEKVYADKNVKLTTFVISPNFYFDWLTTPTDVQMGVFRALKADTTLPIAAKIAVQMAAAPYRGTGTHYSFDSVALPAILKQTNDYSNNVAAQVLFDRAGGASAMAAFLKKTYGVGSETAQFTTGSGLSGNYTTCNLTIKVLQHIIATLTKKDLSPTDVLSMPTVDPGVLLTRKIDLDDAHALVAKSGFLNYHHALAGVINTKKGLTYFALFTYYPKLSQTTAVKTMIDGFVGSLLSNYRSTLKAFPYEPSLSVFDSYSFSRA